VRVLAVVENTNASVGEPPLVMLLLAFVSAMLANVLLEFCVLALAIFVLVVTLVVVELSVSLLVVFCVVVLLVIRVVIVVFFRFAVSV